MSHNVAFDLSFRVSRFVFALSAFHSAVAPGCANLPRALQHLLMQMPIPAAIHGQKYISLATFRKTGVPVYTPIWFAEQGDKLVFMTNSKLGKVKRLRNNSQVKIAPCTIRGKITGAESAATARILPIEEAPRVRRAINAKYWLARLPFLWRNTDTYIEIAVG